MFSNFQELLKNSKVRFSSRRHSLLPIFKMFGCQPNYLLERKGKKMQKLTKVKIRMSKLKSRMANLLYKVTNYFSVTKWVFRVLYLTALLFIVGSHWTILPSLCADFLWLSGHPHSPIFSPSVISLSTF